MLAKDERPHLDLAIGANKKEKLGLQDQLARSFPVTDKILYP